MIVATNGREKIALRNYFSLLGLGILSHVELPYNLNNARTGYYTNLSDFRIADFGKVERDGEEYITQREGEGIKYVLNLVYDNDANVVKLLFITQEICMDWGSQFSSSGNFGTQADTDIGFERINTQECRALYKSSLASNKVGQLIKLVNGLGDWVSLYVNNLLSAREVMGEVEGVSCRRCGYLNEYIEPDPSYICRKCRVESVVFG